MSSSINQQLSEVKLFREKSGQVLKMACKQLFLPGALVQEITSSLKVLILEMLLLMLYIKTLSLINLLNLILAQNALNCSNKSVYENSREK